MASDRSSSQMQRFLLTGESGDLGLALDRLYVACELLGVAEGEGQVEICLPPGDVLPELPGVVVEPLALPAVEFTGRENDVAMRIGRAILVRPPWVARPDDFEGIELVVPRGMAFGSGEHDSTQAALVLLERVLDAPASCLDVGTGSGILALYVRLRGCTAIAACDVAPESVAAARELLPSVEVTLGGPETVAEPADLVVANMRGAELLDCREALVSRWTRQAPIVLSGMRMPEFDPVVAAFGLPILDRAAVGEFHAVALGYER